MPTYDYRCKACAHELELFQSMSDRPKRKCPACGKNQLERLIGGGGGLLFKGSGYYQTDYRSASYTEGAKADADAQKKSDEATKPPKESSKTDKPKNSDPKD
ncbi:MAG TPA: zinc ribbon domain-containing protein [Planctomycetes bacterium]|nr:zinc ribbon domain-containing protein [Planctomycetota bacterium]HIL37409.1 zinc ribbon domain-containing protein [Planctomycetota bacterium]